MNALTGLSGLSGMSSLFVERSNATNTLVITQSAIATFPSIWSTNADDYDEETDNWEE